MTALHAKHNNLTFFNALS